MVERQPVLGILGPSDAQAPKVVLPGQGPFHDPPSGRVAFLFRDLFYDDAASGDVHFVVALGNGLTNVLEVVPLIGTEMMHAIMVLGTRNYDRIHDFDGTGFIMRIGTGNDDGQRGAAAIDENVAFGAQFASIRRIFAGFRASQGRRDTLAINGLPMPLNPLAAMVELDQHLEDLLEQTGAAPGLETGVNTTAGPEPQGLERYPLAARSQHIQNSVHHLPIGNRWMAHGPRSLVRWQNPFETLPKFIRNCPKCSKTDGGTPCRKVGRDTTILYRSAILFNSQSVYG